MKYFKNYKNYKKVTIYNNIISLRESLLKQKEKQIYISLDHWLYYKIGDRLVSKINDKISS